MATKYLSESDLPYLEQRVAAVFAEKPIVAQFTLETTDWESDTSTGKQKCSVAIDSDDITINSTGNVSLDLSVLSTDSVRLSVTEACMEANVRMTGLTLSGSTKQLVFYADRIPSTDLPMVLTIIGRMPSNN